MLDDFSIYSPSFELLKNSLLNSDFSKMQSKEKRIKKTIEIIEVGIHKINSVCLYFNFFLLFNLLEIL
jgi:hypothetical protein